MRGADNRQKKRAACAALILEEEADKHECDCQDDNAQDFKEIVDGHVNLLFVDGEAGHLRSPPRCYRSWITTLRCF